MSVILLLFVGLCEGSVRARNPFTRTLPPWSVHQDHFQAIPNPVLHIRHPKPPPLSGQDQDKNKE